MSKFHKLEHVKDYDEDWLLDGQSVADSEGLEVQWPTGEVTLHRVSVHVSRYEGRGGMDESSSSKRLSVLVSVKGADRDVSLDEDSLVRRVSLWHCPKCGHSQRGIETMDEIERLKARNESCANQGIGLTAPGSSAYTP